jgi:hypothetical protein
MKMTTRAKATIPTIEGQQFLNQLLKDIDGCDDLDGIQRFINRANALPEPQRLTALRHIEGHIELILSDIDDRLEELRGQVEEAEKDLAEGESILKMVHYAISPPPPKGQLKLL